MNALPGEDVTFCKTIANGDQTKFLTAKILNNTGTIIAQIDMDHVNVGAYMGTAVGGFTADKYCVIYCSYDDAARTIPSIDVGICQEDLCVADPSDPAVINVNQLAPAAVEALINLKGTCTNITLAPGESKTILGILCDAVTGDPFDLTGCVVRFYVLPNQESDLEDAIIFKTNYPGGDILVPDPTNGEITIPIAPEDTADIRHKCYDWRIEVSCPATLLGSGIVDVTNGSFDIEDTGVAATWNDGDLFVLTSANAANNGPFVVSATPATSDYSDWTTEAAIPMEVYDATTIFPPGMCGKFTIKYCSKDSSGYRTLG